MNEAINIPLDGPQPTEPGDYAYSTDRRIGFAKVRAFGGGLLVRLDCGGEYGINQIGRVFPTARWSRRLEICHPAPKEPPCAP